MIDLIFWWIGAVVCFGSGTGIAILILWWGFIEVPYRYLGFGKTMYLAICDAHRYRMDKKIGG